MPDQEMIARISKAILETPNASDYETLVAINAVKAMREPTETQYNTLSATNKLWRQLTSYDVWTTYIDAILK